MRRESSNREQARGCEVGPPGFRRCGVPTEGLPARASIERLLDDGTWQEIAGPVGYQPPQGWVGHWASLALSPDEETILARWSGECESSMAFFVPAKGGSPRPVTGERDLSKAPESSPIGWAEDGRARVRLFQGGCGLGATKPGVYLIDPHTNRATLVRAARIQVLYGKSGDCPLSGWYRLCLNTRDGRDHPSIERQLANGRWRRITGPPRPSQSGIPYGQWGLALDSPDGKTLLAQWEHPCDSAHAFFIPFAGGRPRVVTGERDWRKAPVSYVLGWSRDGRARVRIHHGGDCGGGTFSRPGVYLIDPLTGDATFVRPLNRQEGG